MSDIDVTKLFPPQRRIPPKGKRLPYALGWIALWAIALSVYKLLRR